MRSTQQVVDMLTTLGKGAQTIKAQQAAMREIARIADAEPQKQPLTIVGARPIRLGQTNR